MLSFNTSVQNVAYTLIIILGVGYILHCGAGIILPFVFALLFAMVLYPIDKLIGRDIKVKWLSIILSFVMVLLPLTIVTLLFSMQLMNIVDSLPTIQSDLKTGIERAIQTLENSVPFLEINSKQLLSDNINLLLNGPMNLVKEGLWSSTQIIAAGALTFIYTFFIKFIYIFLT